MNEKLKQLLRDFEKEQDKLDSKDDEDNDCFEIIDD